jgi:acetyl-CoA carboxylase biotin carboxyl carrier protein
VAGKPKPNKTKPKSAVDQDIIRELAQLLDETGLTEIEFERDGQRVRVARQTYAVSAPTPRIAGGEIPAQFVTDAASPDPTKHPGLVTSPMVGTA